MSLPYHKLTPEISARFCPQDTLRSVGKASAGSAGDELPEQLNGTAAAQRDCSVFPNFTIARNFSPAHKFENEEDTSQKQDTFQNPT